MLENLYLRWQFFQTALLESSGWQRIDIITIEKKPEFLTAVQYIDQNPRLVKFLWNEIITNLDLESRPTSEEVAEWKGIVLGTQVGIRWIRDRNEAFDFTPQGIMM